MLLGVLDLEHETVQSAMLPRQSIHGINLNDSWETILEQLKATPFSKLPVYRDSIDQVLGIFQLRKVIVLSDALTQADPKVVLEELLTPPYFVPETTSLQQQLINFQSQSEHMALVVDEYGDIQGLVTVEDILEEIVGEFTNLSQPSAHVHTRKLKDGSMVVDGAMTVRDLNRDVHLDLPTEGPRTLSGLIVEQLDSMPKVGLSVKVAAYPIEILEVDDNAVRKAKIYPKLSQSGAEDVETA
jgi:Mg2+/Co2+ transporter CorB